jgi:gluconokinase
VRARLASRILTVYPLGMIVVIMGIAGCGKTTVGQRLASDLGWPFFDGDDFHPAASIAKMASGRPLDDADRAPWLARLRELIDELCAAGTSAVIACSALKQGYREQLLAGCGDARLVYLQAGRALLAQRLEQRVHPFFPAGLLDSQIRALEEPGDALVLAAERPVAEIVAEIAADLAAEIAADSASEIASDSASRPAPVRR